jgi:hypothetical protein
MHSVKLQFGSRGQREERSLSGAAAVEDYLFVAPDEGASILRLRRRRGSGQYRHADTYPVEEFVRVPGAPGDEIDLEGMDIADGYLWLAGSHSAVRTRIRPNAEPGQIPDLLAEVGHPRARRLLARIPLIDTPTGPEPARETPAHDGRPAAAASVVDDERGLHAVLRADQRHLHAFADLPGKDNGLDIESLAVVGPRVLLGLRGPVLRGWAIILEIEPRPSPSDPRTLELAPLESGDPPPYVIKHFLDLRGLGIRDLARHNDDLLILAGPTMVLDGPSRILRLPGGAHHPLPPAVTASSLQQIGDDLPVGTGDNHPEAITVLDGTTQRPHLLVLYDSPTGKRVTRRGVRGDVLSLG